MSTASKALTVPQAANLLGVSPSTLYKTIQAGDFPTPVLRVGKSFRIPKDAFMAWYQQGDNFPAIA